MFSYVGTVPQAVPMAVSQVVRRHMRTRLYVGVDSFSSSMDMSSIRFENFEATVLDSHSVNNKVRIFVVVTQL